MKFLYLFAYVRALPSKVEHSAVGSLQNPILSCEEQIAQVDLKTRINHSEIGTEKGRLSVVNTDSNMNCYVSFGESCADAVRLEILYMDLESFDDKEYNFQTYEYDYMYGGRHDKIRFSYEKESVQHTTDFQCGCIEDGHPSCNYKAQFGTEKPTNYFFVGSDAKLIFNTDNSIGGSKVVLEWQCVDIYAEDTAEMAQKMLKNDFKPEMVVNYGCAGLGTFDAFLPSRGKPFDSTDKVRVSTQ